MVDFGYFWDTLERELISMYSLKILFNFYLKYYIIRSIKEKSLFTNKAEKVKLLHTYDEIDVY